MATRRSLLLAGAAGMLQGCSPLALVNGFTPSSTYVSREDIRYGPHPRHALDVYRPAHLPDNAPVVVFFYGGNWNSGNRADYRFAGEALASKGCVAVLPDYRLYPEVRYPEFLADSALAVRWVFDNIGAAAFGGDSRNVFLMGHSAGAYNAAMLALNPAYLRAAGVEARRLRGLIGLAGPYDFLPITGELTKAVFGFPDTPVTTQPIHFASMEAPPALLATGASDDVVNPGNSTRLAARLQAVGAQARVIVYPGVGHAPLVGALAAPLRGVRGFGPVLDDVAAFIQSVTSGRTGARS